MPAVRAERGAKGQGAGAAVIAGKPRVPVVVNGEAHIPAEVVDLASFRLWARSDRFPQRGRFSYLGGEVWADLSLEQLFSHNQVKGEFAIVLGAFVKSARTGLFFHDRTFLSNPEADLSTEPDGLFFSWDSLDGGRVRMVQGAEEGYVEVEGTPDMVLEVVSRSS